MKLHLLDRSSAQTDSFSVKTNSYPNFLKIWHHHPELELVLIEKSTGTRFIGDAIEKFKEGDVVLIGKNLPHMWLNDPAYFEEDSTLVAEALAIHFKEDFFGTFFTVAPEMKPIHQLFIDAKRGIRFNNLSDLVINKIKELFHLDSFNRSLKFLELLHLLAKHPDNSLLASSGFINSFHKTENKNLDRIYEFVFKNFTQQIHSKEVASIAKMNPAAFSRFFKRIHRKTFTRYLNEIRVGYACKLLMEENANIAAICYASGFNNISNFNRQFKVISGVTPSEYIKFHTQTK